MFQALKKPLIPLAALALILGSAFALNTPTANADLDPERVWFLDEYGDAADTTCTAGVDRELAIVPAGESVQELSDTAEDGDTVQIPSNGVLMCFQPEEGDGNVTIISFDSTGDPEGVWQTPVCGDLDRDTSICVDTTISNGSILVPDASNDFGPDGLLAVFFDCSSVLPVTVRVIQDATTMEFTVYCGPPTAANLTITPPTVESFPAPFNTSHSLIRVELTSAANGPVLPFTEVNIRIDRCELSDDIDDQATRDEAVDRFGQTPLLDYLALEDFADGFPASGQSLTLEAFDVDTNDDTFPDHSEVLAIVHAEECDAGPINVEIEVDILGVAGDIEETGTITVIGPPAFVTITAAPTEVVCGEKVELTVGATDALNQGVSDFTEIEVVTNYGGVLAGTGTSITGSQPVNPLSSTTVQLLDGFGTAYLLTSTKHIGSYEVLAAHRVTDSGPVASQVTVTCTAPEAAPDVIPPDTGTGEIRPPNTGDAGLAAGAANGTVLAVAGAALIALALIARRGLAR